MSDDKTKYLLNRDVVAETESKLSIFPKAIREGVALAEHIAHVKETAEHLKKLGDTTFYDTVESYIEKIKAWGFEEVLKDSFAYEYDDEEIEGNLYIFVHRDGLLLRLDTYGDSVNSSNMYFNTRGYKRPDCNASGGPIDYKKGAEGPFSYALYVDAREALSYKIKKIKEAGLLPVWEKAPFLWLLSHADTKEGNYDYDAINKERISRLPEWVKKMMGIENG